MIIEIVDEKHKIKEKMVQRPSVLEKKINIFASVLKFIENFSIFFSLKIFFN